MKENINISGLIALSIICFTLLFTVKTCSDYDVKLKELSQNQNVTEQIK